MDDRTKLAAMAMQGMLANRSIDTWLPAQYAASAREYADALIAALRETPDQIKPGHMVSFGNLPDDIKGLTGLNFTVADPPAAEAQDEVGDWRKYVTSTEWLRRVADGDGRAIPHALVMSNTPQGRGFWEDIYRRRAEPAKKLRALEFARRVLEAMEKEDD